MFGNICRMWMSQRVIWEFGRVRMSLCVLPETLLQLLPITAGMYPWVGCQQCSRILLMRWPPASATCEILTFHIQILPMNSHMPHQQRLSTLNSSRGATRWTLEVLTSSIYCGDIQYETMCVFKHFCKMHFCFDFNSYLFTEQISIWYLFVFK